MLLLCVITAALESHDATYEDEELMQESEWYAEATELLPILRKYLQKNDQILHIGAGKSKLGPALVEDGFVHVTNTDLDGDAIRWAKEKYPRMTFIQDSMTDSKLPTRSADVIIDKGCFDSICFFDKSPDAVENFLSEIQRILDPNGRFFLITSTSHAQKCGTKLHRGLQRMKGADGALQITSQTNVAQKNMCSQFPEQVYMLELEVKGRTLQACREKQKQQQQQRQQDQDFEQAMTSE